MPVFGVGALCDGLLFFDQLFKIELLEVKGIEIEVGTGEVLTVFFVKSGFFQRRFIAGPGKQDGLCLGIDL